MGMSEDILRNDCLKWKPLKTISWAHSHAQRAEVSLTGFERECQSSIQGNSYAERVEVCPFDRPWNRLSFLHKEM